MSSLSSYEPIQVTLNAILQERMGAAGIESMIRAEGAVRRNYLGLDLHGASNLFVRAGESEDADNHFRTACIFASFRLSLQYLKADFSGHFLNSWEFFLFARQGFALACRAFFFDGTLLCYFEGTPIKGIGVWPLMYCGILPSHLSTALSWTRFGFARRASAFR